LGSLRSPSERAEDIPANMNLFMHVNVDVKGGIAIVDDTPSPAISSIWAARGGNLEASAGAQPCPAAVRSGLTIKRSN
jgi:hypothetical protein